MSILFYNIAFILNLSSIWCLFFCVWPAFLFYIWHFWGLLLMVYFSVSIPNCEVLFCFPYLFVSWLSATHQSDNLYLFNSRWQPAIIYSTVSPHILFFFLSIWNSCKYWTLLLSSIDITFCFMFSTSLSILGGFWNITFTNFF